MDSATSGESRERIRRFGSGLIGRSGYIGDVVSGEWTDDGGGEYAVPM